MGEIYRVKDHENEREVALKLLIEVDDDDPARLDQFEQQARSASALNHPNIATVHDIGMHRETPYVVTELVEGKLLTENLANGPLTKRLMLRYAAQIAEGLARAHAEGIVHGSLTPGNLMVTDEGTVKIFDFGVMNLASKKSPTLIDGENEQGAGGAVANPNGYDSPEQIEGGDIDSRADQFSLGRILSEMATGATSSQSAPSMNGEASLPRGLRAIVDRCTKADPKDRYESTQSLCSDLRKLQRRPWIRGVVAAAIILAALAVLFALI
jgi:serine/threonine protein kinase